MKNLMFFIEQHIHTKEMNYVFRKLAKEGGIKLDIGELDYYVDELETSVHDVAVEVGEEFVQTLELLQTKLDPPYAIIHDTLMKENDEHEMEIKLVGQNVVYKGAVWVGMMNARGGVTLSFWLDTNKLELIE